MMRFASSILLVARALSATAQESAAPAAVNAPRGARIEAAIPAAPAAMISKLEKRKDNYSVKLQQAGWVDSGVQVRPGDTLIFAAEGSVTLADGRTVDPDGAGHGWRDMLRQFAIAGANTGALVGRIGDSVAAVPFVIGASSQTVARQGGHLYLCVNLPANLFVRGEYMVKVHLAEAPKTVGEAESRNIATLLPLETFAHIPRRVQDAGGNPGDVVNFALIGTEQQVTEAFARSGWVAVDKSVDEAIVNGLFATLERKPYVAMPMSALYLFGRVQDLSFARADAIRVAAVRHHLRVWKTEFEVAGTPLWVGSATFDNGFARDERNGGITHRIDEKIDEERDFIRDSFWQSGSVSSAAYVTPIDPVSAANTATGGAFTTDGRILVLDLK